MAAGGRRPPATTKRNCRFRHAKNGRILGCAFIVLSAVLTFNTIDFVPPKGGQCQNWHKPLSKFFVKFAKSELIRPLLMPNLRFRNWGDQKKGPYKKENDPKTNTKQRGEQKRTLNKKRCTYTKKENAKQKGTKNKRED